MISHGHVWRPEVDVEMSSVVHQLIFLTGSLTKVRAHCLVSPMSQHTHGVCLPLPPALGSQMDGTTQIFAFTCGTSTCKLRSS